MSRKLTKRNGSWTVTLDLGFEVDEQTGTKKRRQQRITIRAKTKKEAERKLTEIQSKVNNHEFVEPNKITFGDWLDVWVETAIKPPIKRLRTYESYKSIIDRHLKPHLGNIRLQELDSIHLEKYYRERSADHENPLSQTTLEHHHAVISQALKSALRRKYIEKNICPLVENRPKAPEWRQDVLTHCWEAHEAKTFLNATKTFSIQSQAFYASALDTGARKGELCGLKWPNVDLDAGTISIVQQLVKPGRQPVFGPPKNGKCRTIKPAPETITLLRKHKAHQAEIKMKNRLHYHDHGLVFAKEWEHLTKLGYKLGDPLQMNNLGQREYAKIIKAAGIRAIKFHGLRHTCATLLLKARVPVHVVSERLGHKDVAITMNIYAHVLPSMQEEAAAQIGSILYGS